jgi:hypothetical protein
MLPDTLNTNSPPARNEAGVPLSVVRCVHLHGAAADAAGVGAGLTASELIAPARALWNGWLRATR